MANFKEGLDAFTSKKYDKALEILSPFAEEGDAEAQFHLAKIYQKWRVLTTHPYACALALFGGVVVGRLSVCANVWTVRFHPLSLPIC